MRRRPDRARPRRAAGAGAGGARPTRTTGRLIYGTASADVALARPVDIVRREDFDADLVTQARARGIEVVEGEGLASFEVEAAGGRVHITTSRGRRLSARILVGADGVGSRVRRALMLDRPRDDAGAGQRESDDALAATAQTPLRLFKAEVEAPPSLRLGERMIYDFSPMDDGLRGYVWLFPVAGGRVNVGAMHYPSRHLPGAQIERLLRRTLERHGLLLTARARGWPAWRYHPRGRIAGPHLLCVGDAAGIDALTGEGIAVGLEQGAIAAAAIAQALSTRVYAFADYSARIRAAVVGRELALDRWAAGLLYAPSGFELALSMIMFDPRVRALYAARVSGSAVLADQKTRLLTALARQAVRAPARLRRLRAARAGSTGAKPTAKVEG